MSVIFTSYVGFYIKVNRNLIFKKDMVSLCPNKKCKIHNKETDNKFCGQCGTQTEKSEKIVQLKSFDPCNVITVDNIIPFYMPETFVDIWIPDGLPNREVCYRTSYDGSPEFEIPYSKVESAFDKIKENRDFKFVIEYMNNTYGEGSASIKYGSVSYVS